MTAEAVNVYKIENTLIRIINFSNFFVFPDCLVIAYSNNFLLKLVSMATKKSQLNM